MSTSQDSSDNIRWFGHVQRSNSGCIGQMMLMQLSGRSLRGFTDVVKEAMQSSSGSKSCAGPEAAEQL